MFPRPKTNKRKCPYFHKIKTHIALSIFKLDQWTYITCAHDHVLNNTCIVPMQFEVYSANGFKSYSRYNLKMPLLCFTKSIPRRQCLSRKDENTQLRVHIHMNNVSPMFQVYCINSFSVTGVSKNNQGPQLHQLYRFLNLM